jgi:hypothetical protein
MSSDSTPRRQPNVRHHSLRPGTERAQGTCSTGYLRPPQVVRTDQAIYPNIVLVQLADKDTWERFFSVIEWVLAKVRRSVERGLS